MTLSVCAYVCILVCLKLYVSLYDARLSVYNHVSKVRLYLWLCEYLHLSTYMSMYVSLFSRGGAH